MVDVSLLDWTLVVCSKQIHKNVSGWLTNDAFDNKIQRDHVELNQVKLLTQSHQFHIPSGCRFIACHNTLHGKAAHIVRTAGLGSCSG